MKNSEKAKEQIKGSIRRLYEAKLERDRMEQYYEEVKKKEQLMISNFMFANLPKDENSFDILLDEGDRFYSNHVKLQVTRIRTKKITWLIDRLRKNLTKEQMKQVIDKTYTVTDMKGLTTYLKSCGVDPKKFKKFISVEEEVNEAKLSQMYDTGEIKKSDVAGCYDLKIGEPYIRLTEKKG